MRVLLLALVIGIVEIIAISKLHQEIGLLNSIYLYVAGTCIGGLLLYFNWKEAKLQLDELSNIDISLIKSLKNNQNGLSENDAKNVKIIYQSIFFIFAVVFVCIPGVVSDILGILLAPLTIRSILSNLVVQANTGNSNA